MWHRWLQETADIPEVARRDPNGGAIDCKEVWNDNSLDIDVSWEHAQISRLNGGKEGIFM